MGFLGQLIILGHGRFCEKAQESALLKPFSFLNPGMTLLLTGSDADCKGCTFSKTSTLTPHSAGLLHSTNIDISSRAIPQQPNYKKKRQYGDTVQQQNKKNSFQDLMADRIFELSVSVRLRHPTVVAQAAGYI